MKTAEVTARHRPIQKSRIASSLVSGRYPSVVELEMFENRVLLGGKKVVRLLLELTIDSGEVCPVLLIIIVIPEVFISGFPKSKQEVFKKDWQIRHFC